MLIKFKFYKTNVVLLECLDCIESKDDISGTTTHSLWSVHE